MTEHGNDPKTCPACHDGVDREAHALLASLIDDAYTRGDHFEVGHAMLVRWKRGEKPWPGWERESC